MLFPLRNAIARRALFFEPFFRRLHRFAQLSGESIPVGVLGERDLARYVSETYAAAPDFYDPSSYQFDYETEILPLLEEHRTGRQLLDLFCGQGREAAIFARAGYSVTGVDTQRHSIEHARKFSAAAELEIEFVEADLNEWEPESKDWDVVYTSLWMLSTVPGRDARRAWLKRFASWGRLLVLSVTPRNDDHAAKIRFRIAKIWRWLSLNRRTNEFGDRVTKGLFWHDFASGEAAEEIRDAGLNIVASLEINQSAPCHFYLVKAS
ncbi:MAG: class I SAM-dependent methyltransferase [Verrucomicrobiota bacterium]